MSNLKMAEDGGVACDGFKKNILYVKKAVIILYGF